MKKKTAWIVFWCCLVTFWAVLVGWMLWGGGSDAGANSANSLNNADPAKKDDAVPPPPTPEKPTPEKPRKAKPDDADPPKTVPEKTQPVRAPSEADPPTPEQVAYQQQHQKHIGVFWKYLQESSVPYSRWIRAEPKSLPIALPVGPRMGPTARVYLNRKAASTESRDPLPHGSIVVAEHFDAETKTLLTVTAWQRVSPGYCAKTDDWYWMHFLADGTPVADVTDPRQLAKRGFVMREMDDALWVFPAVSRDLVESIKTGKTPRGVTLRTAGPRGSPLKAVDRETLVAYQAAKPGFIAEVADGDVWVFREGSDALTEFRKSGKPKDAASRSGAGPFRSTVNAVDQATLKAYLGE